MIVITAATKWEAEPLESALAGRPNLKILRTGMGPVKARQAAERLEIDGSGLIVISSGLAGALQPGMRCGDLAADVREAPLELVQAARADAEKLKLPIHMGVFAAVDHVVTATEKRELGAKRMVAVDMESGALRDWTRAKGGTFLAFRAVFDELEEDLPTEIPGEGLFETLRFAARHWKRIPTLAALGRRQRKAMHHLADFLGKWLDSCEGLGASR